MATPGEQREQILAVFAHELRQPLASILFAIQSVTEVAENDPSTCEACEIVERQTRYLIRMIEEVLNDCRTSSGKPCIRRNWFDLGRVIDDAIEATCALIAMRGHQLRVTLPQDDLWVNADALHIQQIAINLLTNAAKYTEPGGCIHLSVKNTDGTIIIEVGDNGVGISESLLPRVFDLFCQGAIPSSVDHLGLGVGLAVVKSLVTLHEGTIHVHSDGAGTGSTFTVSLPGTGFRFQKACQGAQRPMRRSSAVRSLGISPMGDA